MDQKELIFRNMTDEEISSALKICEAEEKTYEKGEYIFYAGDTTELMGMVIEGSVTIESNDAWGNRTILSHVGAGQFFGETYALLGNEPLLVDVTANESCRIMFLRLDRLRDIRIEDHPWAYRLMMNLLGISARKNLKLSHRNFHTAPKTIRGRVLTYLNSMSIQSGSREFDIPFDRQQLADYLNTDRSALSKELGDMQREGLISFKKNHFIMISEQ